jgi:hypothetical protein
MGPKRDWSDVDIDPNDPCRFCGVRGRTTRAHVSGRKYDEPKPGRKTLWVNPLDVVPLCGPVGDSSACHTRFDAGEIDLLPYLTYAEQARAVYVLGGIESARMRLAPLAYPKVAA